MGKRSQFFCVTVLCVMLLLASPVVATAKISLEGSVDGQSFSPIYSIDLDAVAQVTLGFACQTKGLHFLARFLHMNHAPSPPVCRLPVWQALWQT